MARGMARDNSAAPVLRAFNANGPRWEVIEDVYGYDIERDSGNILHEEREGSRELRQLRNVLGEVAFAAQYQQAPIPSSGASFQRKMFRFYDRLPGPPWFIVQSWDHAISVSDKADISVCTTWAWN